MSGGALLTLHQLAERLQVHWSTVRLAVERGELRVIRLGKTAKGWRVDPADLEGFIAEMKSPPGPPERPDPAPPYKTPKSVRDELDRLLWPKGRPRSKT
jgi:excisionase family DNA binding protein